MKRKNVTENNCNATNNVNIERLGGTALCWLSMHDTAATLKVLREFEEKADEHSREILHDIASMITQFKKDLEQ